jgi:ABC-2 type transport system permease protein
VCSQVAAARREEAGQQLEMLFALPVPRGRWLAGRVLLAAAGAVALAAAAATLAWVGAASQHAGVSLPRLLEAGANCLPTAFLFLALSALALAVLPRAATGISYGLVATTFLWQLVGAVLGAPQWLLDLSPFQHVALVPAQAFRPSAAAAMLALAALGLLASFWAFRRRDLAGS